MDDLVVVIGLVVVVDAVDFLVVGLLVVVVVGCNVVVLTVD